MNRYINTSLMFLICFMSFCLVYSSNNAIAGESKIVEGNVTNIYHDKEYGEAYFKIKTSSGLLTIEYKPKGFNTPIAIGDFIKAKVKNMHIMNGDAVCNLVSVIKHIPAKK
jgi:hypothetical protein